MTTNMTGLKQRKTFEEVIDYIQMIKLKLNTQIEPLNFYVIHLSYLN